MGRSERAKSVKWTPDKGTFFCVVCNKVITTTLTRTDGLNLHYQTAHSKEPNPYKESK